VGRCHPVSLGGFHCPSAHGSLIAHPKDRVATLQDVQALPFFTPLAFPRLRETPAPFVPVLDGDTDVGYFDSFESAEDMAKYAEVFKKQRDVEAVEEKGQGNRNNWVGFTFGKNHVSGRDTCKGSELMSGRAGQDRHQARGRGSAHHVLIPKSDLSSACPFVLRLMFAVYTHMTFPWTSRTIRRRSRTWNGYSMMPCTM
jgi:non-specific serine/threonine protein kinase